MTYEMVGKFHAWRVGIGVLKVDNYELFVFIGWE
jgi:hypothetical protein